MPPDPLMATHVLRRSGQRPLRFQGDAVHRACWHFAAEADGIFLGLYQQAGHGLVVEMGCVPPRAAFAVAWHDAVTAADLAAAVACLESAEPFCAPAFLGEADTLAGLRAAALRLCLRDGLRCAFRHAVGAFLYDLCALDLTRAAL